MTDAAHEQFPPVCDAASLYMTAGGRVNTAAGRMTAARGMRHQDNQQAAENQKAGQRRIDDFCGKLQLKTGYQSAQRRLDQLADCVFGRINAQRPQKGHALGKY